MIRPTVVTTLFLVFLEVLGARQHVSVLSGTVDGGRAAMFMGLLYALTFFAVVILGPPALLTGLLLRRRRAFARCSPITQTSPCAWPRSPASTSQRSRY